MRKLLFMTLISLVCFACSDDPLELGIKTLEISLYPEDIVSIEAVSDFDITYLSENPYLVDVSAEGMLTAHKVGKTSVEVSSHNRILEVSVDVMGRYNVYPDPVVEWGMSQSDLIKAVGEPDKSYANSLEYADYSEQSPNIAYLFTPGDSLMCALVIVLETYSDELTSYMNERFIFDSKDDNLVVYRNGNDESDTTMLMGIFNGGMGSLMVMYIEYKEDETKSQQSVTMDFKNIQKDLRASLLKKRY